MVDQTPYPLVPIAVIELVAYSQEYDLKLVVDSEYPDHVLFQTDAIMGFIVMRPAICDRGRWLLHAASTDPTVLTVDHQDGFPRYYFEDMSVCRELRSWLYVRGQLDSMKDNPKRPHGQSF